MNSVALPRLETLQSNDDDQLTAEFRLARLRAQVAVVRTLSNHIERFARAENAEGLSDQLTEEVARLGFRLLEAAASLTRSSRPPDSGVFSRRSPSDRGQP